MALWLALVTVVFGAPATVLEHTVEVTVSSSKRLTEKHTWTVRVEDADAVAAGIIAPSGLDGAADGEAMVLENVLLLPADVKKGQTFTLSNRISGRAGAYSGVFMTAPDLPVEKASFKVSAPSWMPLTVWTDDTGEADFSARGTRTATVEWSKLDADDSGMAAWSTWKSWLEAGEKLESTVSPKLASREVLGPRLAADIKGSSIGVLADRVMQQVKVVQGEDNSWENARKTTEIIKSASGSAAERGVVLISLLRAAGFDARPAAFRRADERGRFPITVPAPALVKHPLVAVQTNDREIWIDPGSDSVAIPATPASLADAVVWRPGDLPFKLDNSGVIDGVTNIATNATIKPDGSVTWTGQVTATGVAAEAFRRLLSPLDEPGRTEVIQKLVKAGNPGLERFTFTATGIEDPHRPLAISMGGFEPEVLKALGPGLAGVIRPTLGPALTSWLPPRILVRETTAVTPPPGLAVVASDTPGQGYIPEAMVSRSTMRDGSRTVLATESMRPYRIPSPQRDQAAEALLMREALAGTNLVLFGQVTGKVAKAVKKDDSRSGPERVALEAMLWWSANNPAKAKKVLKKGTIGSFDDVVTELERLADEGDSRPWTTLQLYATTDVQRLRLATSMEKKGLEVEALKAMAALTVSTDARVKVEALLAQERLQSPKKPDDPELAAIWVAPTDLLSRAGDAAKAAGDDDPRVLVRRAELNLRDGKATAAEILLEKALNAEDDPAMKAVARVLLAQAGVQSGLSVAEVVQRIDDAVDAGPFDARVARRAAGAMNAVGQHARALDYALSAARLAFKDPTAWTEVADYALANGDLMTATFAGRRASDLVPDDKELGQRLSMLATMAGDHEAATLGRNRTGKGPPSGKFPPPIDVMMEHAPPDALLALLNFNDGAVVESPINLGIRAQMRIENGHLDAAVRDGVLLAERHANPEGTALAFAATAGRLWSSTAADALKKAAREDFTARSARMEYLLVSGGDAYTESRSSLIREDPRAQIVQRTYSKPAEVAGELEGWPADLENFRASTPKGFRSNRLLSKPKGVLAWSDATRSVSVLRVAKVTGLLPPPIGNLFTPREQPLESLEGGGQVLRLDGGIIPLYAATAIDGEQEVIGLGYTPGAAKWALKSALPVVD